MTYGLLNINDSSRITIDDVFSNYQIYSEGVISINNSGTTQLDRPEDSIVLLSADVYSSDIGYFIFGTNIQARSKPSSGTSWPLTSSTIKYIVLIPVKSISITEPSFGLEVVDSANLKTFSSSVDIIQYTEVTTITTGNLKTTTLKPYIDSCIFGLNRVFKGVANASAPFVYLTVAVVFPSEFTYIFYDVAFKTVISGIPIAYNVVIPHTTTLPTAGKFL